MLNFYTFQESRYGQVRGDAGFVRSPSQLTGKPEGVRGLRAMLSSKKDSPTADSSRLLKGRPSWLFFGAGRLRLPLVRSTWRTAWCASAVLVLLPVSRSALAQTATSLVSNLGQTVAAGDLLQFDQAQAFTTGSSASVLTRVDLRIRRGSWTTSLSFSVSIHSSDSSGLPGDRLGTLRRPAAFPSLSTAVYPFTASGNGIALDAGNTYFVVLDSGAKDFQMAWLATSSGEEDASSAAGWSIDDMALARDQASADWKSSAAGNSIREMAVYGRTVRTDVADGTRRHAGIPSLCSWGCRPTGPVTPAARAAASRPSPI